MTYEEQANSLINNGAPYENRTRVSALRGPRPGPLDEGSVYLFLQQGGHVKLPLSLCSTDLGG